MQITRKKILTMKLKLKNLFVISKCKSASITSAQSFAKRDLPQLDTKQFYLHFIK